MRGGQALSVYRLAFQQSGLKEEMRRSIVQDRTLSEEARQDALELVESYREDPGLLNKASWDVVRLPHADAAACQLALRQIEAAVRLDPDNGLLLNTKGVAHYRLGRYKDCLATLTCAAKLNTKVYKKPLDSDLAFLAMSQYRLGQRDEARTTLTRLRQAMKAPGTTPSEEDQGFLREAEALIGAQ